MMVDGEEWHPGTWRCVCGDCEQRSRPASKYGVPMFMDMASAICHFQNHRLNQTCSSEVCCLWHAPVHGPQRCTPTKLAGEWQSKVLNLCLQSFTCCEKFTAEESCRLIPTYEEQIRVLRGEAVVTESTKLNEELLRVRKALRGQPLQREAGGIRTDADELHTHRANDDQQAGHQPLPSHAQDPPPSPPPYFRDDVTLQDMPSTKRQKRRLGVPPCAIKRASQQQQEDHAAKDCCNSSTQPAPSLEAVWIIMADVVVQLHA